jgi:glycosyltransferase involved in cell wall biosynthesis
MPFKRPLVSVLMTSYNREKYIAESINSVLASSYQNFELIIVDDASIDNTVVIARQFELKDNRVKVFVNDRNLSDYHNRNKAASFAKGKYIKYLDSDDIIYPWGLEAMVTCMERFPQADFGLVSYGMQAGYRYPILVSSADAYRFFYFKGALFITGPSGAIIKREVFERVKGFSGKRFVGDTELWLQLSRSSPVVAMPVDLVWWRQHDEQQMRDELSNCMVEAQRLQLYKEMLKNTDCPLPVDHRKLAFRNLVNVKSRKLIKLLLKGKINYALSLYKAFKLSPLDIVKSCRLNKYPA